MKKILTLALVLTFLTMSVSIAFAQPPQRITRGRRMFDRPQYRILAVLKANKEELNITDEQLEQVQNLVLSFREKSLRMQNENSLTRLELQKLMLDKENLDYGKIEEILSKASALRNEMFIEGLKLREKINSVLTPEQREALKAKAGRGMRSRVRDLRDRMQRRFPRLRPRIRR